MTGGSRSTASSRLDPGTSAEGTPPSWGPAEVVIEQPETASEPATVNANANRETRARGVEGFMSQYCLRSGGPVTRKFQRFLCHQTLPAQAVLGANPLSHASGPDPMLQRDAGPTKPTESNQTTTESRK